MWNEVFVGEYKGGKEFSWYGWDQLLGHFEAIIGFPWVMFVEEFTQVYPDAKVVLRPTVSDIDAEGNYVSGIQPTGNLVQIDRPGVLR